MNNQAKTMLLLCLIDHTEEFCNKVERCLQCSKEDNKSEYCQATKAKFKCLTCEKKHVSYCSSVKQL